jgi:hypothetical protein
VAVICPTAQAENFWQKHWTEFKGARQKFTDLPVGQINAVAKSGKSRLDCQRMLHPGVDVIAKTSS